MPVRGIVSVSAGAAAGALTAAIYSAVRSGGKTDISMTGNGVLAGLVGITAGADAVAPWAAILVGIAAGVVVSIAVPLVERAKIDDADGAFSVHGVCGILGTWWVGFFSMSDGLFYGGDLAFLGTQFIGPLAVAAFVMAVTAVVCLILKSVNMLRVDDEHQREGLDVVEHVLDRDRCRPNEARKENDPYKPTTCANRV
jgi:ammonium transporter, Amt family